MSSFTNVQWADLKTFVDKRNLSIQYLEDSEIYYLKTGDSWFQLECNLIKLDQTSEVAEFEADYKSLCNRSIDPLTDDGRMISAINRVPAGYSIFLSGGSDHIANGTFGDGTSLCLDGSNKIVEYQLINNYYAIGGTASWMNSDVRDYLKATLKSKATIGASGSGYDFTKESVGTGVNLYKPVAVGTGDWKLDIDTVQHMGKELLKVNPVPVPGNTGHFDYNKMSNKLVVNANQMGGYNLYDFDVDLFAFGNKMWGVDGGGIVDFVQSDVVGKLVYANWIIEFELVIHDESNRNPKPVACVNLITATMKNI